MGSKTQQQEVIWESFKEIFETISDMQISIPVVVSGQDMHMARGKDGEAVDLIVKAGGNVMRLSMVSKGQCRGL